MELTERQRATLALICDTFAPGTPAGGLADASCFPTASGVNPMVSIEAIAHMNASRLAARL